MKNLSFILVIFIILFFSCKPSNAQLEIQSAFPNLTFNQPVDIQNPGDGTNRLFVVSQPGRIYVFDIDQNTTEQKVFLDLTDRVLYSGEQGLLGLAFHPDYKNNGYFYVDYTTSSPRRTVIARFKVSDSDPNVAVKDSELVLLEVNQPYTNHNGGQLRFGSDGYLYISFGDGGSGGDPQNHAQDLTSLLGKILRIDVDNHSDNLNYSIPPDNPFKGNTSGAKEEIYAYGLRNVWRFSFDPPTERLWAADVGQDSWEEIDLIEKGKNYGWHIMEGFHCYNPISGCDTSGLTLPVWEYGHDEQGGSSITGGFVYRGNNASEIYGKYIYADYESKNIWALDYNGNSVDNTLLFPAAHSVTAFGIDQNNELYFTDYSDGKIYKFKGTPVTKTGNTLLPDRFKLEQNYPNPFNPETEIKFQISEFTRVQLKVYDLLGRLVTTLIDEDKPAGIYTAKFGKMSNTSNERIASGIYFYQLRAGNFISTKKMLLVK
jgi:glucose/arabinose dehydrogenase